MKQNKKDIKKAMNILKTIGFYILFIISFLAIIVISSFAGIGMEKYIYQLNYPLGPDYAHVASYLETATIAIFLWIMLNKGTRRLE